MFSNDCGKCERVQTTQRRKRARQSAINRNDRRRSKILRNTTPTTLDIRSLFKFYRNSIFDIAASLAIIALNNSSLSAPPTHTHTQLSSAKRKKTTKISRRSAEKNAIARHTSISNEPIFFVNPIADDAIASALQFMTTQQQQNDAREKREKKLQQTIHNTYSMTQIDSTNPIRKILHEIYFDTKTKRECVSVMKQQETRFFASQSTYFSF
jgi:hypothetical protein